MTAATVSKIRNIALIGHGGAGKTSLVDAVAYVTGMVSRRGSVDQGTSVSDFDPEEVKRRISIHTSLIPCTWKETRLNLLDTPGYFDFAGEVASALRVADSAVAVVCGVAGVEVRTEQTWQLAQEYGLPLLVFVNKLDRENARFNTVLDQLRERFGSRVVPLTWPIGSADQLFGVVDLLQMKIVGADLHGGERQALPDSLMPICQQAREVLLEAIAATDDELALEYLEGHELEPDRVADALATAVRRGQLIPVLGGSALQGVGLSPLLNAMRDLLPSPAESSTSSTLPPDPVAPLRAFAFKTMADPYVGRLTLLRVYSGILRSDSTVYNARTGKEERVGQLLALRGKEQQPIREAGPGDLCAVVKLQETVTGDTLCDVDIVALPGISFPRPVLSMAVAPRSQADEERLGLGLARLAEEDPTLTFSKEVETGQVLLSGLGEQHLEVAVSRLQRKFGVSVDLSLPRVPYRETIRRKVQAEYKHKKQTGGRGQYGHVFLRLEPMADGGYEFVDQIVGGVVPRQFIPAVEKGVRETMASGVLAGYPVVGIRVILYDGSHHSVDSSELAFKIAAAMAFKKAFLQGDPVLLEPILRVEVDVPETYMGDVIGDLNKKRGRILGMEQVGGMQRIRAQVPMAEMFRYAIDLRSMTQGRGEFRTSLDHYAEVPAALAETIIAQARKGAAAAGQGS